MPRVERQHEVLSAPLTEDALRRRAAEGWAPVAVIWEREVEGTAEREQIEPVPYGLRVATDCRNLEPNDIEVQAMILMLKLIIDERPFAEVADQLNASGFRTRHGGRWNQTSIFYMLPRLIEAAPEIYSRREWLAMKPHLQRAV